MSPQNKIKKLLKNFADFQIIKQFSSRPSQVDTCESSECMRIKLSTQIFQ